MSTTRRLIRDALAREGGVVARGAVQYFAIDPIPNPFATGTVVEGNRLRSIPLGQPVAPPEGIGFADGIQQWVVDGHFGLTPVVRGFVHAAVMVRRDATLTVAHRADEEFVVVAGARLTAAQHTALEALGLPVHQSDAGPRPHPLVDLHAAVEVVERRREAVERRVAHAYLSEHPGEWLVVDGAIGALAERAGAERVIGLIKSHETQFLDGEDLAVALTLAEGHRSSVFERSVGGRYPVYSWYLRMWPWTNLDLLHGLTRLERRVDRTTIDDATTVSRWMFGERAPLSAPDTRWDRLIYPIHAVETYLRAHAGGWS